jgi:endonuclease YncB( thermonuclease family)
MDRQIKQCRRWFLFAIIITGMCSCEQRTPPPAPPPPPDEPKHEATVFDAIQLGDQPAFDLWLNSGAEINLRGNDQTTPLMHAARHGRTTFVRQLLDRGADHGMVDLYGFTALHAAARDGRSEIIRMLLEAGANPNTADYDGLTAYDIAMMMGHTSAGDLLAEARAAYASPTEESTTETTIDDILPSVLLSTDFRLWTSASGDTLDAAFIQSVFDTVILQKRDGSMMRIAINRLSPSDQILARQLSGIDPHALARARPNRQTAQRVPDSAADKIGKNKGWTVLEGARLLKRGGNDGDSFHVTHDGKEFIFRLYFVDAAETRSDFPDRVKDQADYFKLDTSATLKLGKEAEKFTTSVLAASSFTVYTKWEDAKGNSQLPRFYAFISTPLGDLDELLTQEGLVRQYGMPVQGNDADRKKSRLRKLEQEAKQNKVGAWRKNSDLSENK